MYLFSMDAPVCGLYKRNRTVRLMSVGILSLIFIIGSFLAAQASSTPSQSQQSGGTTHYVSTKGNNQDGTSWQSAWNELNQIRWDRISPGDTILLDGGIGEMTYRTSMDIKRSGSSGKPITIKRASEPGRDGQVILYGGRRDNLPNCWIDQYNYQESGIVDFGIRVNRHSWIVIDGREWRGIDIHGFGRAGVRMDHGSHNVTVRNLEIYNNGYARDTSRGWYPDGVGIRLAGHNVLLERNIIHDNGQDAVQSIWGDNGIRDLRINQSWHHNSRPHHSVDESWNYCTHTDGMQLYDGGFISGITIEESIMGPGFTNNLIMGQTRTSQGSELDVHDVLIRDVLFMKAADNSLFGYQQTDSRNWVLDNVTMHCPKTKWHCVTIDNHGHTIRDSIIYDSRITFTSGISNYSNNCIWKTEGSEIGTRVNPAFVNVSDSDMFSLDNYALASNSPCAGRGSKITSVQQLLQMGDTAPIDDAGQPLPTPTPLPQPTATPNPQPQPLPTPVPPEVPPEVPPVNGCGGLVQEAENAQLHGMFKAGSDSRASGNGYVGVPDYSGNRGSRVDSNQRVEFCVQVDTADTYRLVAWSYAESGYDNSFYVRVNGQPGQAHVWHTPIDMSYPGETVTAYDSRTKRFTPLEVYLSQGTHTVSFYLREDGTRLDKIELESVNGNANRSSDISDYASRLVNDIATILENLVDAIYIPLIQ